MDRVGSEKRKKRVLTSARKEQNRAAQKAYRQRQREILRSAQEKSRHRPEKLLELRPKICQVQHTRPVETVTPCISNGQADPEPPDSVPPNMGDTHSDISPEHPVIYEDTLSSQITNDFGFSLDEVLALAAHTDAFIASFDPMFQRVGSLMSEMTLWNHELGDTSGCIDTMSGLQIDHGSFENRCSPASFDQFASYGMAPRQNHFPEEDPLGSCSILPTPPASELETHSSFMQLPTALQGDGELQGPSTHNFTTSTTPPFLDHTTTHPSPWSFSLPNPYTNHLSTPQTLILHALSHNARILSISLPQLMTRLPLSPFYRATSPSTSPQALLASVRHPSYPIHLQPTLPQILFPHHAYLDLLPFPGMRARLLAWTSTPQLFDLVDFKIDVLEGGLVPCGGGQPWDVGSWRAEGWFLRKWRLLVG